MRHASAPTVSDRHALKRLIRSLSTTRSMTLALRLVLTAAADADWASIAVRKSVTGDVVLLAGCFVASLSRTQASNALSSCEAELLLHGKCSGGSAGCTRVYGGARVRERTASCLRKQHVSVAVGRLAVPGRLKHVEVRPFA